MRLRARDFNIMEVIFMPRKAKSAIQQQIDGNPNRKTSKEISQRVKNEEKMDFGSEKLQSPAWLNSGAKKAFKFIVDTYAETNFLNDADLYVLTRYCDLYSEYLACNRRLKKNGRSEDGKVSGDLRFKLNLSAELGKLEKEMGLTPAARASLAIHMESSEDEPEKDEFDEDFDQEMNQLRTVK